VCAVSRRTLLASFALVGTAACSVGDGSSAATSGPRAGADTGSATSAPVDEPATALSADALLVRQLERATFGPTAALLATVRSTGFDSWLDDQLAGAPLADPLPVGADQPELLTQIESTIPAIPADAASTSQDARQQFRLQTAQGVAARVVFRSAFAPDQVRQRVVDFFADRLHVSSTEVPSVYGLDAYDRMLRTHALGRFEDLLVASATSPSMLWFLDNSTSRADRGNLPNENFARELLELHTVGVDGGYDEVDVVEVAHVFSGWTIGDGGTAFRFRPEWHDLGTLATSGDVLGWSPEARGEQAGRSLLAHLARLPCTAQRLVHGLARHFVSEDLTADHPLVVDATKIYMDQDTALAPVVRHLLTADEFGAAATLMARRPVDLLATMLRRADAASLSAEPMATRALIVGLSQVLGQLPYGWPAPDGYPTGSAAWTDAGALISRWNAATTLATGGPGAAGVDETAAAAPIGGWSGLTWSELGATPNDAVLALCGPEIQLH